MKMGNLSNAMCIFFEQIDLATATNYTAIGDNVNLASRLEGINKQYSTEIIVSQDVVDQVGKEFLFRPLGFVKIKGKDQPLFVYELLGSYSSSMATQFSNKYMDEVSSDKYKENVCIY